jgi:hypothetical protein
MAEHRADWRRPRTLLRDLLIHLRTDAELFEQAEQDVRAIGGEHWMIGLGRYPARAERRRPCRRALVAGGARATYARGQGIRSDSWPGCRASSPHRGRGPGSCPGRGWSSGSTRRCRWCR